MAVGTLRTITVSVTIPANATRSFNRTVPTLPAPHCIESVTCDNPAIDVVGIFVNALPARRVQQGDVVSVLFANPTGGSITANVTATISELPLHSPPSA